MAVVNTVLKKVRQQAVVKLLGSLGGGQANVTSLDIALSDETLDQPNVKFNVTGAMWSASDGVPIIVSRNGTITMYLNGNDNWSMSQMLGFTDTANNGANINVVMPANSLLYLHLTKASGFIEPTPAWQKPTP